MSLLENDNNIDTNMLDINIQDKSMLQKLYNWSSTWTGTVVIVLSIIFFVAQAFVIPSGSMKNTLLIGDMLFVKKFAYGIPTPTIPWFEVEVLPDFNNNGHLIASNGPKRGDITVFRYPNSPKIHYVKRCVAQGGDILFLKNKSLYLHPHEGDEYIQKNYKGYELIKSDNMLFIKDPYKKVHSGIHNDPTVTKENSTYIQIFDMLSIQVPKDNYFMMGDNRDHSNDSRFWGAVPYRYIVGTPWFVYFSWDENKKIRWERIFQTIPSIEKNIKNTNITKHKQGIY
jgi:signal peptidase I